MMRGDKELMRGTTEPLVRIVGEQVGTDLKFSFTASPSWWKAILAEASYRGMNCSMWERVNRAVEQLETNRVEV